MITSRHFSLDQFAPIAVYEKAKALFPSEVSFLLESAGNSNGNYTIIIIGARERLCYADKKTTYTNINGEERIIEKSPFAFLKAYYSALDQLSYREQARQLGIGYIDGFIGYIGYDMVQVFEPTLEESMSALLDQTHIPDMDLILPKLTLVVSHKNATITMLSCIDEMISQFEQIESTLKSPYSYTPLKPIDHDNGGEFIFTKDQFFKMVDKSKEMIKSGDVFQILMTNRYIRHAQVDPFSFYRILRLKNPSPYMYLMEYEEFSIVGSSPEVMVRLSDGDILLRPIAGTRKRGGTKARDLELEEELLSDPKELAEHLMLIDLGRNDVGRVAKTGTVRVEEMMHVERYSHVMHIVSDVHAEIADNKDMFDLLAAVFTAGTMTGAPKIRAMELIAEYEGVKRSFYSGTIGYFGFDGNMDSAITIRTALIKSDTVILQAGAGVVADSIHELEYLEVTNKLGALMGTLDDLVDPQ
ncbi:anthranilate synthase component I family protein [Sulfuricurvum sp.]|uniref:anthranilate synthase component I family protein n=1 Tax=Sulfuricurvum sp. TaxID=2025608 RepID=UPI0019AD8BA7|nr:anthranilate synthase component I family protein [Sulfuricurvum sp.]MBD3798970.1 anthranilate synthase component I family protein [Campylobacterota bacterium]MBD3806486.1 anthranilate synthase component I family protein [Sulfuricurvum sp.]